MVIPSLKKLTAYKVSNTLNNNYVDPPNDILLQLLDLPSDILRYLFPLFHYRWLNKLLLKKPELEEDIRDFLSASMRREEDFQRTKSKINVPLISTTLERNSFIRKTFPSNRLCLSKTPPFSLGDDGQILAEQSKDFSWNYLDEEVKDSTIVSLEEFKENFAIFTENQLQNLNWENVFAAGGSVFACIRPTPKKYNKREFYHDIAFESSDIDLFIYGLSKKKAAAKVAEIYNAIKGAHLDGKSHPISVATTDQTITFVRGYPYRCIQVVVSNFQYPSEVLANFDIDCVCFGYNGEDVFCLPRGRECINTGVSIINSSLSRISYRRIMKWKSRGLNFGVPDFVSVMGHELIQDEKKLDMLLAIAKMNLLHNYNVEFDWSDNIKNWDQEFPFGVSLNLFRSIIRKYKSEFKKTGFPKDDAILNWDSSCGVIGVRYSKLSQVEDAEEMDDEEIQQAFEEISDTKEKWTWEGAPEFKDWNYNPKGTFDIALLRFPSCKAEFSIPTSSAEFKASVKDSLQNVWVIHSHPAKKGISLHLELENPPSDGFVPAVALFTFGDSHCLMIDISHRFCFSSKKSISVTAFKENFEDKLDEQGNIVVKVDIRVLQVIYTAQ